MAMSGTLTLLLFCLVLCTQALEQRPTLGRRSKRDFMAAIGSFFSNVTKRLDAVEARFDNSTEERLAARLEAKLEGEMQKKLLADDKKLQDVQNGMKRLEVMITELISSTLEAKVTEILNSKMKSMDGKMKEMETKITGILDSKMKAMDGKMEEMEAKVTGILDSKMKAMEEELTELKEIKTNATEERLASLETSNTEAQSSPASCRYQYLYRYEKESPRSSGDLQWMTKLATEMTRLQEKMSTLDKHLQDNDLSMNSFQNASVLAIEGVVHSTKELLATSEQNLQSIMQNTTEIMASRMSDAEARLLAKAENNAAVLTAFITRVEQITKELATHMSTMEDKLDNATSVLAEKVENARTRCGEVQGQTKDPNNRKTEAEGTKGYRRTCQDYYDHGQRSSGTYKLLLKAGQSPMEVYCDMRSGTGWVVFQRRLDGSVDFYRNWTSYEDGFGDLNGEFWLGNRNIHRLTSAGLTQLRVDLQAWNGSTAFASYSHFSVGDASSFYRLSVSGYLGTAGDSLQRNDGNKFTTLDQNNSGIRSGSCSQPPRGAWWYKDCGFSDLNGVYGIRGSRGYPYVRWNSWRGTEALQFTELRLK